ncbi:MULTISPECIES: PEP/pyruvate-binding domain-containing protein [unclassified Carboxylicivirga]|uniref:PEP/pyruvate-binding domain-containing protein n=1 Tax=Carboxylicivirga TaxID=1628153 RepID=UPI003D32656D
MTKTRPHRSSTEPGSQRVLLALDKVLAMLQQDGAVSASLQSVVESMIDGFSHKDVCIRIRYGNKTFQSEGFEESMAGLTERFSTIDGAKGVIDVYYRNEHAPRDEGAFTRDERSLINQVARMISDYLNKGLAQQQHSESIERLKELSTINRTTRIINEGKSVDGVLQQIAFIAPQGWQYPEYTVARIQLGDKVYTSEYFIETEWVQTQRLQTRDGQHGSIDIFYTKSFPAVNGDPFLPEERDLLITLSRLITDFMNDRLAAREMREHDERLKELHTINETARILALQLPPRDTLQQVVDKLPAGMQYPNYSVARIRFEEAEFVSPGFAETPWLLHHSFETIHGKKGSVEIYYLKELAKTREELFLNEENDLVLNLCHLIVGYLNGLEARRLMERVKSHSSMDRRKMSATSAEEGRKPGKHLLQNFMHHNNAARDIYHDLMPFRVKEILLVATLYDAYAIENEGRFTEQVMGGFHQLHLSLLPRVTGVTTYEEAISKLNEKHFDLIIVMVGVEKQKPMVLSQMVKEEYPYIPIFMLLNSDADIPYFQERQQELGVLDEIYVWNGDPKVFSSMVFHLEDQVNIENDTAIGLARVILLVEDSVTYYSKYLPLLYASVLEQTKRLIDDVKEDELYGVLRLKARPKIILARTYEEAQAIIDKYRDYLLCMISDVEFSREGKLDVNAGFDLVSYAKQQIKDLPVILQSAKIEYSQDAYELKTVFINKYSDSLIQDIKTFISRYLGFGNFVYKDAGGRTIAVARNLKEFERAMRTVPVESIVYHARKNHFSLWLMARGEIKIARKIAPYRISDFEDSEHIRSYLLDVITHHREEKNQGKVIAFDEVDAIDDTKIVSLSGGSLGGKGRGLSFINTLLFNFDFERHVPGIKIRTPRTTVVGTDEFEMFIERNKLRDVAFRDLSYHRIKKLFMAGELSSSLVQRLKRLLGLFTGPLAVRSSGLLEDSLKQPFSGVFETYLLPNNADTPQARLQDLCNAVKLVFASVYSDSARAFTEAVDFKIEEEKMAVVIQEAVGHQYGQVFYPSISGVAQSYNYYSFGHMNPEDGFAVMALGFGKYVVDGEKALRFCPAYPDLDNNAPKDQLKNSQTEFYAIDLEKKELNLLEGDMAGLKRMDIYDAEMHGTLAHLASVYNPDNNTIQAGLDASGPRIINFADILKYNYIPLSKTLEVVLDVVREAMGAPVEIEFAVDLKKDKEGRATFYLLQIKPLLGSDQNYSIDMAHINPDRILLQSVQSMGNGINENISDIIYVDSESFDKAQTRAMSKEIEQLNAKMKKSGRHYILIGAGRWGTRDPWIGIPVSWPQIGHAKMIVETDLDDFPLEASGGSHFFHNVTTMQVGYCSVVRSEAESFINWELLKQGHEVERSTYFRHVRFDRPLSIRMDGKRRKAVVTLPE